MEIFNLFILTTILISKKQVNNQSFENCWLIHSIHPETIPPVIRFNNISSCFPPSIKKYLYWRSAWHGIPTVREFWNYIPQKTGFQIINRNAKLPWIGWTGMYQLSSLKNYQKYNIIPGSNIISNKAKLTRILKEGKDYSNISVFLETYVLPEEMDLFKAAFLSRKHEDPYWIIKPSGGSMSRGIKVIKNINSVEKKFFNKQIHPSSYIIQKYLFRPWLLPTFNQTMQLRTYVLVTSLIPLRLYILHGHSYFRIGLGEYKTNSYCAMVYDRQKCQVPNYSWVATAKEVFEKIDPRLSESKIQGQVENGTVIIFLKALPTLISKFRSTKLTPHNLYQLFAVDWLLDETGKAYFLELNTRPITYSGKSIPLETASELAIDVFNIVGFYLPPTIPSELLRKFTTKLNFPNFFNCKNSGCRDTYTREIEENELFRCETNAIKLCKRIFPVPVS